MCADKIWNTDKIQEAYSSRNNDKLCKELQIFHHLLIHSTYALGPAAVSLQLRSNHIAAILNKLSAIADSGTLAERIALQAGAVSAYLSYFEYIANREDIDSAEALFSDSPDKSNLRVAILKTAFSHIGTGKGDLVRTVVRFAKADKATVNVQIRELLDIGLLERIKVRKTLQSYRTVTHYRITRLGEAIVARRFHPCDLALFFVDVAASNKELRDAMKAEIKGTWPKSEECAD